MQIARTRSPRHGSSYKTRLVFESQLKTVCTRLGLAARAKDCDQLPKSSFAAVFQCSGGGKQRCVARA